MICPTCMAASDQRAPRTQHCDDPGCTCGHNVQRYGTVTAQQVHATAFYGQLTEINGTALARLLPALNATTTED